MDVILIVLISWRDGDESGVWGISTCTHINTLDVKAVGVPAAYAYYPSTAVLLTISTLFTSVAGSSCQLTRSIEGISCGLVWVAGISRGLGGPAGSSLALRSGSSLPSASAL